MEQTSVLLKAAFIIITLLTVLQFYRATNRSKIFLVVVGAWMLLQLAIAQTGFYTNTSTTPPRLVLLVLPPLIAIFFLFITKRGRSFLSQFDEGRLTLLHTIRVAVEIVLYYLFLAKTIPEVMTFAGRNLDIISGITAPVVYYFAFIKKVLPDKMVIAWNVICLGLLVNIVVIALLSTPTSFQHFGFEQPNIAIAYFPFVWLPAVVVPLVLLSHLVVIRARLLRM